MKLGSRTSGHGSTSVTLRCSTEALCEEQHQEDCASLSRCLADKPNGTHGTLEVVRVPLFNPYFEKKKGKRMSVPIEL